jgi:membrane protease YdiL (CAAX protease family)
LSFSRKILDLCYLVVSAVLVCAVGLGAFAIAEIRHVNPLWVVLSVASLCFVVGAREDYRKEFRSVRFVLFACGWVVINVAIVVVVLGSLGWLYLIPALLLEQFLFYMTAYCLFGVQPPRSRPPFDWRSRKS